jgi:Putative Actinobacterial Holin-X, holin superfamily III
MSADSSRTNAGEMTKLVGLIVRDSERLLDQHVRLLRSELHEGLHAVPRVIAEMGAGAVCAAVGGGLGVLMIVHGLHRSTRLPLWSCYGLVGGALAAVGAGLMSSGARKAASISLLPRETIGALREDARWIKNQIADATS